MLEQRQLSARIEPLPPHSIDDLRYLGGATTWLGRERPARCGLKADRVKFALWMEGKKCISGPS